MNAEITSPLDVVLNRLTSGGKHPFSIREATAALGVSRALIWKMIKAEQLCVVRLAGRTLIPAPEVARLLVEGTK